jgi:carbon-monoxide dehydrogenase large subunit
MAESGTAGVLAVVANAVADALRPLGVEVTVLPLSPAKVTELVIGSIKSDDIEGGGRV